MIYFVTSRPFKYNWEDLKKEDIVPGGLVKFFDWIHNKTKYQLDVETTMTPDGPNQHQDRELLVLQLGDKSQKHQWVFDMVELDSIWIENLQLFLSNSANMFIGHNIRFEYLMIQTALNVKIENMHDTYVMSRVLNTGLTPRVGYHSLAGCLERFFDIVMDKEAQTTFTRKPLSKAQILYAAMDVVMLFELGELLAKRVKEHDLWYLYNEVERHIIKVYADMELTPMGFNASYWRSLTKDFIEERDGIVDDLNKEVLNDSKLVEYLKHSELMINQSLIQPVTELKIKWNSTTNKKLVFNKLFPYLPSDVKTKPQLKKWLKDNDSIPLEDIELFNMYMIRDYDKLNSHLLSNYKEWLIENNLYVKEGTILINWASPLQKLYIFQFYYPNLKDTNANTLAKIYKNKLINIYKKFSKAEKSVSSYGENFIANYLRRDGMIAPFKVNSILNTGRISFGILLQLPGKAKFRNAFLPPEEDWVFVDTDYSSQEIACMAFAAQEESLLQAIRDGKDAHSLVARMMFPEEWKEMAEEGCIQLITGAACECKKHLEFRKKAKSLNFGIPYGMSSVGLADRLDCEKSEAQNLMDLYFKAFPKLAKLFDDSETFAMENNYIRGLAPTKRIRFFAEPENSGEKKAIGRQGKNFPIQEAGASILKTALISLRTRIIKEDLPVRLHLPVHDEILASCPRNFSEEYAKIQGEEMMKAADKFLEEGLLGVDTDILDVWTK